MKPFKCRKLRCKGMSPKACIKRQFAQAKQYGAYTAIYSTCAQGCKQGLHIAWKYPNLVPDGPRPIIRKSKECPICNERFIPTPATQINCSRECGKASMLLKRRSRLGEQHAVA